ncbi:MAG: type II secretion system protein GspD [Deltaproteobacteria bacterium]|nr:MAG: type II secretion system protein GspD [Deltaproteobacteria bacterium]
MHKHRWLILVALLFCLVLLRPLAAAERHEVELQFEGADVAEVLRAIVGKYLGKNFIFEPGIGGRVTLYIRGSFTDRQLMAILEEALSFLGIQMVEREDYILVVRTGKVPQVGGLKLAESPKEGAVLIYRVRFIPLKEAEGLVRPFLSPGALMKSYKPASSLLLLDRPKNLRTVLSLLRAVDQPLFSELTVRAVDLKQADPEWVVKEVEALFGKLGLLKDNPRLKEEIVLLPLKEVGKILVFTTEEELFGLAKRLIETLDVSGGVTEQRVWIRFIENGKAEEIASLLSQIFAGAKPQKKKVIVKAKKKPSPSPKAPSALTVGPVQIIPDRTNNALIIKATPRDYRVIEEVIQALDILPRQVFIEVTIAEVTLKGELSYGVEWFLKEKKFSAGQGFGLLPSLEIPFGGGPTGGFLYYLSPDEFLSFLSLLSSTTDVRILSNPTVIAVDNQPAKITVGGRVPTLTQTLTTAEAGEKIVSTVQYQTYGIILTVTPHISSAGMVRLEIRQEYTDVQQETFAGLTTPSFVERAVDTNLVTKDGQTVLLGGLIQTKENHVKKGIPLLKDVPLIGPVFGHKQRTSERTELIIAITPHVIKGVGKETALGHSFMEKLEELKRWQRSKGRGEGTINPN